MANSAARILVGLRCRPPFEHEVPWNSQFAPALRFASHAVHVAPGRHYSQRSFGFDYVWPPSASQERLYLDALFPIVQHVLKGHDGTVMAYGQTGTGKTYTMGFLDATLPPHQAGIIPRVFEQIFSAIEHDAPGFRVSVSFLQIYMENVYDLLVPPSSHGSVELPVRPTSDGTAFYVDGLQSYDIGSLNEAHGLIGVAMMNRSLASTARNPTSSRSHTLLKISLTREHGHHTSTLSLVDLAGSERPTAATAFGISAHDHVDYSFAARERAQKRLNEAKFINSSLSALGNVIAALSQPEKQLLSRCRESKLTKLLKGVLGGCHVTLVIATVDSAPESLGETLSTLKFAARCKKVPIRPPSDGPTHGKLKANITMTDAATQTSTTTTRVTDKDDATQRLLESREMQLHMQYQEQLHKLRQALDASERRQVECCCRTIIRHVCHSTSFPVENDAGELGRWQRRRLQPSARPVVQ
ncbi:hypothetical protein, variant [Aphanomyces invadans]|uniref:Kinesin-like protein n=1 Tax=Aphanomyces invadans TaxID=157072 RepID=A0A024UF13_9STRA|nr:hypothetical protein, variant [Aphanomyces invadans]ETW04981.1 hypothetical protein, variant [Aphanomyces invadans]|eukprot:XP_008866418.1 hypothetical protein, variant [Aphanomyces invadans]